MEQKHIQAAIDYKKNIAGRFVLVEGAKLKQRVEGERLCVTRKIDGHLQVVFWEGGKAYSSDEKQIREIFEAEIAENVKKGWEEV